MSRWEPRHPVATVAGAVSVVLALSGCQSTAGAADTKQVCGTQINSPAEMTSSVWYQQLSPSASSVTIKDGGSLWVILTTDCAQGFQVSNGSRVYQVSATCRRRERLGSSRWICRQDRRGLK